MKTDPLAAQHLVPGDRMVNSKPGGGESVRTVKATSPMFGGRRVCVEFVGDAPDLIVPIAYVCRVEASSLPVRA